MNRFFLTGIVVLLVGSLILATPALACNIRLDAVAYCDEMNQVVVMVSVFNAEPTDNPDYWSMNVSISTDYGSGGFVLLPAHIKSVLFFTGLTSVPGGTASIVITWTDGKEGTNTYSIEYTGTACQIPISPKPKPTLTPTPEPEPVWHPGGLDEFYAWEAYLASLPTEYQEPVSSVGYDVTYTGAHLGWLFYNNYQLALYEAVVQGQEVLLPQSGAVLLNGAVRLHQTQPTGTFTPEQGEWVTMVLFGGGVETYVLGEYSSVDYGSAIEPNTFATCNPSWTGVISFPLNLVQSSP